jgi:hypothetical protein
MEVNGVELKKLLDDGVIPEIDEVIKRKINERWIFRICGRENNCN